MERSLDETCAYLDAMVFMMLFEMHKAIGAEHFDCAHALGRRETNVRSDDCS